MVQPREVEAVLGLFAVRRQLPSRGAAALPTRALRPSTPLKELIDKFAAEIVNRVMALPIRLDRRPESLGYCLNFAICHH
jgi:hypothetical protein